MLHDIGAVQKHVFHDMEIGPRSYHVSNTSTVSRDDDFGPFFAVPGQQNFDFTLLFEDTILSILPSSLLLLVVPFRIGQLWKASRKVTAGRLRDIKLVTELDSR